MNKETTVLVVDDDAEISVIVKSMIQACGDIMVLGGPAQSNVFEFKDYHQEPIDIHLKKPTIHGSYRQFIKRDKPQNFR
jgi:hypothetical protein